MSYVTAKYAAETLFFVRDNPGVSKMDVVRKADRGSERTRFLRIQDAVRLGLVEDVSDTNISSLYVTHKGMRVISHLSAIYDELGESDVPKREER